MVTSTAINAEGCGFESCCGILFFFGISLPNIVFTSVRFCNKLGLSLLVGFSRKLGLGLGLGSVSQCFRVR